MLTVNTQQGSRRQSSYQKSGASFYDEIDYLKTFTCTLDIVKWPSVFIPH